MRRREFITLVGGAALTSTGRPFAAHAQPGGPVRRIGALIGGDEGDAERQAYVAAFRAALSGLGWTEGRNVRIDWRWATGDASRAQTYAAELVALKPDLLFGDNTFVLAALQQATRAMPIVFARVTDPIGSGFVASLARPGGNITGFADAETSARIKLVEVMREIAPNVTRVAILSAPLANLRGLVQAMESAASLVGLRPIVVQVKNPQEIEDAIANLAREPNGSLIADDPFLLLHRMLVIDLAARHKLPAVSGNPIFVRDGGLMSYGVDLVEQYRGAASYVDRILKGAKPADLPVQLPIKYRYVVNMKTAKALGLDVPLSILMRIDEVIE